MCVCVCERVRVQESEEKVESELLTSGQPAHAAAASAQHCQSAAAGVQCGGGIICMPCSTSLHALVCLLKSKKCLLPLTHFTLQGTHRHGGEQASHLLEALLQNKDAVAK